MHVLVVCVCAYYSTIHYLLHIIIIIISVWKPLLTTAVW